MKTVLGLDISSRNVGFALISGSKMLCNGVIKRKHDSIPRFCQEAAEQLTEIIHEHSGQLSALAYEVQYGPIPACRRKAMTACWTAIGGILTAMGCFDIQIPIQASREDKAKRKEKYEAIYGECTNEHAVDALAVAHRAMNQLG